MERSHDPYLNLKWVAQPDGKFTYVADRRTYDGRSGSVIVRVLPDGQSDPTWSPVTTESPVTALALAPGGALVVAEQEYPLFRLRADGSRDPGFHEPSLQGYGINDLVVDREGRVLALDPQTVWRLLTNGLLDPAFLPPVLDEQPRRLLLDAAGNPLVIGPNWLIRLHPDGTRDSGFATPVDPVTGEPYRNVQSVLPLADGSLLVISSQSVGDSYGLMRLGTDGKPDPGFAPRQASWGGQLVPADGGVWLLRKPGYFLENFLGWLLERLLPDGSPDPNWNPQRIFSPLTFGRGAVFQFPRLVALPGGDLMVLNSQTINGHPRHSATRLHLNPGLRVVVDPSSARVPENAGVATLRLWRSGPVSGALTLGWATEPITAAPGVDYTAASGTVTFPAEVRDASIAVTVLDNDRLDRDRRVRLRFTSVSDGLVPPPAGFAVANDDPGFPPDAIRALADGWVLLRPTGCLDPKGYLQLRFGTLKEIQSGSWMNTGYSMPYNEPFPEIIFNVGDNRDGVFFQVGDPSRAP